MLQKLLDTQKSLNEYIMVSRNIPSMEGGEWVSKFLTALIHEAIEARDETNWKWWKDETDIDPNKLKEELVDVLHFLLSAFLAAGMDSQEIVELYMKKNHTNIERQS